MPKTIEQASREFPGKPRCCDWCEKRHTKANPLTRVYVESDRLTPGKPDSFHWWVHEKECAEILLADETITFHLVLGGY